MKRVLYLLTAALVAMLILVPTAIAQGSDSDVVTESTTVTESTVVEPLPQSGGPLAPSVLLPATVLLVGSGVVTYALVRRR